MLWMILPPLFLWATLLQIRIQVDIHRFDALQMRFRLYCAGLHKTWQYHLQNTPDGHQLQRTDSHGSRPVRPSQVNQGRIRLAAAVLRRADKARHFLMSHLHMDRLDVLLLLRIGDAAHSALFSGAAQGILCCLPVPWRKAMHIRVLPEFFRQHSTVDARCIIRFRLGTIILTAMMLLSAYLRQHLKESEESAYGTSHR